MKFRKPSIKFCKAAIKKLNSDIRTCTNLGFATKRLYDARSDYIAIVKAKEPSFKPEKPFNS